MLSSTLYLSFHKLNQTQSSNQSWQPSAVSVLIFNELLENNLRF